MESEDTQRRGFVLIVHFDKVKRTSGFNTDILFALPCRVAALHMCVINSNVFVPVLFLKWLTNAVKSESLAKIRFHEGE